MSDQDNLRDRIAAKTALRGRLGHVIDEALREKRRRYCECTTHEHVAQAIIDEFGLHYVDSEEYAQVGLDWIEVEKGRHVVGKWEKQ